MADIVKLIDAAEPTPANRAPSNETLRNEHIRSRCANSVASISPDNAPHGQIVALIDVAARRLSDARTSGQVLEARVAAQAALHYARLARAANDTLADCLRIIVRAEMRLADAVDEGQEKGVVATAGENPNVRTSDNQIVTFAALGIPRQRLMEFRHLRDAGPEAVEQAIQEQLAEGKRPTRSAIVNRTTFRGNNEWHTPPKYIELARTVLGTIDLDPASSALAQLNVRAGRYFTEPDDGLTKEWNGRVWLNPPFAQPAIRHFIDKAIVEHQAGRATSIILLAHNYSDTTWFHKAATAADAICFTRGRIRFTSPSQPSGVLAAPTQGQAFFYFGPNVGRFAEVFVDVGLIVRPWARS